MYSSGFLSIECVERIMAIPEEFTDLFEKQTFAHFSTLLPDGTPHVTPVWVDYDAETERLLIKFCQGRIPWVTIPRDECRHDHSINIIKVPVAEDSRSGANVQIPGVPNN